MVDKKFIIREAKKEDASQLIELIKTIANESKFLTFAEGEFNTTVEEEEDIIEMSLQDHTSLFLVAEISGKIVGNLYFSSGTRSKTIHFGKFGVSVKKAYWRLGIAKKMMFFLIDWAKTNKITRKINLEVHEENINAIHLYEKLGFVVEGKISRYFCEKHTFHSAIIMGLEID
ncbi:hypothetical protein BKP37_13920 [Anaerobacillus alkalilacustris]|uniref:N-acetyltransferase domain-containing protein n=1 Tax=Anaerobacillus alkalilacustris TaxID=393763 RepID=A0A1S2LK00_9BACI|nr:GNAT family N-acetyltransferase [Anaerobacillus alkalilacustris]OIJ12520.1 hypothetical protein BKP37_13920 [Anaerobacillus alkalilacustris]